MIRNLGLLYVGALREKDIIKKAEILAKIERTERTLLEKAERLTYKEQVIKTDQEYKDKVFWLAENSNSETIMSIKNFTLGWAVEFEKRLVKKINDRAKRDKQRREQVH